MDFVHRWGGAYFGYFNEDDLHASDGRVVGQRRGIEIYGRGGNYLGEVRDYRLITDISKKSKKHRLGFMPPRLREMPPRLAPGPETPLSLPEGFEDFPAPNTL